MIDGTQPAGAACASNLECQSGACNATGCADYTCCAGTCAGGSDSGELAHDCWAGTCHGGWCSQVGGGQLCLPLIGSGGACSDNIQCADGYDCVAGFCGRLPGVGESCAASGACDPIDATCGSDFICATLVLPGNPCTADSQCARSQCDGGTCTTPALGQPCRDACAGAVCVDGTCVAPGAAGAPCSDNGDCQSGTCDDNAGACVTPPACP